MGGGGGLSTEDCLTSSDCFVEMTLLLHLGTDNMRNLDMKSLNTKHLFGFILFCLELDNLSLHINKQGICVKHCVIFLLKYTKHYFKKQCKQQTFPFMQYGGLTVANADNWLRTLDW